ncbi:MAG: response regulator [Zetaproteobacteria bacterium]|nr:MAG: response regulator [Zetaproteobacteria bacterium]
MSSGHNNPQPYNLSNFSILLVEDSIYLQTLTSEMLRVFGVGDILTCANAKEATDLLTIAQARTSSRYVSKIDILLTDWLMPNGDGKDLLNWVRTHENDAIRFLPIIVVSGFTTERLTNSTRDLGANEILVKPISGKLLASRICSIIDHPRPFIDAPNFFGPDRRRQDVEFIGEDRRNTSSYVVETNI